MSSMYGDEHRELQDRFDSRALADTLEAVTVMPVIDDAAKAFIESRSFFFLSTVDGEGQPTVSYKGGAPGFVRVVDDTTLVFPSYDGNGMYLSMGNIAGQGRIGLLFIDFETPHRIRIHAEATLVTDGELLDSYPGADLVVRATVTQSFVNCGRYIPKRAIPEATHHLPDEAGQRAAGRVEAHRPPAGRAARARSGVGPRPRAGRSCRGVPAEGRAGRDLTGRAMVPDLA
jgi:uncharacterized protein